MSAKQMVESERPAVNLRKEKRIKEKNDVIIKAMEKGNTNGFGPGINAVTYDVSLTGARIHTEKYFAAGTVLKIVIDLAKTGQFVQIEAEVKWIKRNDDKKVFEMGVEFLHSISQTILSLIKHLYGVGNGMSTPTTLFGPQ